MSSATDLDGRARPGDGTEERSESVLAARALAVLRVLLLPIVFADDQLVSHPTVGTVKFDVLLGFAALYSGLLVLDSWRPGGPRAARAAIVVFDLLFVGALAYESGRAFSELYAAFLALPLGAALLLAPRRTALVAAATAATYLVVAFIHPATHVQSFDAVLAQGLYVAWIGVAGIVLASLLARRRRRIVDLAAARGTLVAQAAAAEERGRKQFSDALHDHVIQNVLTARQDLAEARTGDPDGLDRADIALQLALAQLRTTVQELHPYLLDHLDLPSTLQTIAEQQARRGGYQARIEIDPDAAGHNDQLLASLARELLANATRHANANHVTLRLARENSNVVLEITDDGVGFTDDQQITALRAGHIGLASGRERIEACGGTFELYSNPGQGTRARCTIPATQQTHAPDRDRPSRAEAHTAVID